MLSEIEELMAKGQPQSMEPTAILSSYIWNCGRNHEYEFSYADGAKFLATYFTAFEDDNAGMQFNGETIEHDGVGYEEFYSIVFEIMEVIKDGPQRFNEFVTVNHLNFPESIRDVTVGEDVYSRKFKKWRNGNSQC